MKRSHAVNSGFLETNKARSVVSRTRSLATPRCGTAQRKAWPIVLREERCCQ